MASKAMLNSVVVLRILALGLLAGSVAVLVTNNYTLSSGEKTSFKDIIAYRFVLATGIIGCVYMIIQIPFALHHAVTEKRKSEFLPEFDFYGDKIIGFLLATGVGAGFAVSFELKKILNQFIDQFGALLETLGVEGFDEAKSKGNKFLDRGNIATGLLFLGFLCVAILSVLSSINRTSSEGRGFFR